MKQPLAPLSVVAQGHPITVYRVDGTPRLWVNCERAEQSDPLQRLHTHFNYEVFFVVSETLELLTPDRRTAYTDSVVIIPPQIHHVTLRSGESYCLLFSFEGNSTLARYLEQGVCALPITETLTFYIRQLTRQSTLHTEGGEQAVAHLAALIFQEIFRTVTPQAAPSGEAVKPRHIDRIDEYVNRHYPQPITLSDLAAHVHLSRRQTARILQRHYRCTFTELVNEHRLANAVTLLRQSELSVAQIIERTFCHSPAYFYRLFEKKYGISPLQYRKSLTEKENPHD